MDFHELYSLAEGANSIEIKNCNVSLTLQNNSGQTVLHVDAVAFTFENYDMIQQFLVERGVDFLEHDPPNVGLTITHFEVHTELTLWLDHKIAKMNLGGLDRPACE